MVWRKSLPSLAICIKLPQAGIDVGIGKEEDEEGKEEIDKEEEGEEGEREESIAPLVKYPKI